MAVKKCPDCNGCVRVNGRPVEKNGDTLHPFRCDFCKKEYYYSVKLQKIIGQ